MSESLNLTDYLCSRDGATAQLAFHAPPPRQNEDCLSFQVSAAEIKAWQQHSVYFGSTVASVCRSMTTRQVAAFFAQGILCVRAYDPSTGSSFVPTCTATHLLSASHSGAKDWFMLARTHNFPDAGGCTCCCTKLCTSNRAAVVLAMCSIAARAILQTPTVQGRLCHPRPHCDASTRKQCI